MSANAPGLLSVGTDDRGVIRRTPPPSSPTSRMFTPGAIKLRGLQMQRKPAESGLAGVVHYWQTWDWTGWIKPQIDLAVASGANAVKWFYSGQAITGGTITRATAFTQLDQFLDYTDGLGLSVYLTLNSGFGDPLDSNAIAEYVALAAHNYAKGRTRLVGYDMCNEGNGTDLLADVLAYFQTLRPALLKVMGNAPVPLSTGISCGNIDQAFADAAHGKTLAPYVDFYDIHPYFGSGDLDVDGIQAWWRTQPHYKPWVVGECGQSADASGGRTPRWSSLGRLAALQDCFGSFGYTTVDFEASPHNFGMWRTDLTTGPDSDTHTPFLAWPTHP